MGWIAAIFIAILIINVKIYNENEKIKSNEYSRNNDEDARRNWLIANNVNVDAEYRYISSNYDISIRYIADNTQQKVYVSNTARFFNNIPFSEIIGCEIREDSQVIGGVKRAVFGGMIAGDAGAIVGAVTAKKEIQLYQVIIYRKNIHSPQTALTLINTKQPTKNNTNYSDSVEFARKVNASIKSIIAQNDSEQMIIVNQEQRKPMNDIEYTVKNKLNDLKELFDSELISEDEYNTKRTEIINSI